jgi:hypothetical protein
MQGADLNRIAAPMRLGRRLSLFVLAACAVALVAACSGRPQVQRSLKYDSLDLQVGDLERYGVAFITPSSVTGQEQDREGVAFLFARVLQEQRPQIPVTSLAETLGEINRAGLANEYMAMFEFYEETGMLPADTLRKIGELTGQRYIAVLKLASFEKRNRGRLSIVGIRFIDTKIANLRLFYQLWDSRDGSIAWEANQELTMAYESIKETFITFDLMVETIAMDLVDRLPRVCSETEIAEETCPSTADGADDGYRVGGVQRAGENL